MKELYLELLTRIGEDTEREGLRKTPERAAKAFLDMTEGYRTNISEIVNGALFPAPNEELVLVDNIEFYSLCEHHLLPFFGRCHVAYIPNRSVIGLSKIPRIVDAIAHRLQLQEQLTQQIADCIQEHTGAKGVAVLIDAEHLCLRMRGAQKQNSRLKTSAFLGLLKDQEPYRSLLFKMLGN